MSTTLFGWVLAGALATATISAAQNPPSPIPRNPEVPSPTTPNNPRPTPSERPSVQGSERTVTVEGCLAREADVPGRKPNIAERAGVGDDYILTRTRVVRGTAPAARAGAAAASGMYEVEGIDEGQLKQHVGHRVQIDGEFDNIGRAAAAPERNTPTDDLVELRGSVIRQVSGDCAVKP